MSIFKWNLAALAVVIMLACCQQCKPESSSQKAGAAQMDLDVFTVVLASHPGKWVIPNVTLSSEPLIAERASMRRHSGPWRNGDYFRAQARVMTHVLQRYRKPVTLVNWKPARAIILAEKDIKGGSWDSFYQKFPDTKGILRFTTPVYNSNRTKAEIYIRYNSELLNAGADVLTLEKGPAGWKITKRNTLWIA
jgi:hypothetical protein